ncbi:MAG: WxL protein peptidoglycan domain-containing protein [Micrococcaceae bacterium]
MTSVLSPGQPAPTQSRTSRNVRGLLAALSALVAVIAVLVGSAVVGGAAPTDDATGSEGSVSWGIGPVDNDHGEGRSSFSYQVDPGDTIEDTVRVINYGTRPLELQVYGADGLTTSTGNFDLQPADHESTAVGLWLSTPESAVTVAAGESEDIDFSLTIPEDAGPGDHLGGIITSQRSGSGTVALDQRLASRIVVSVSGDINATTTVTDIGMDAPLAWIPFAPVDATVNYTVENTGNTLIRPISRVSASLGGAAQDELSEEINELMPTGSSTEQQSLSIWPFFVHQITVETVSYTAAGEAGELVETTAMVVVIPWGTLVVILLLAGGLTWFFLRRRKAKKAAVEPAAPEAAAAQPADVAPEAPSSATTTSEPTVARPTTPPPLPKGPRPNRTDRN